MDINTEEFYSKFYNDFLMLKAEVTLLRSILLSRLSDGDKEKIKKAHEILDEEKVKLFDTIALESDFGNQYLDDKTKKMMDDIKTILLK